MKKIIALFAALALLCAFTAASAEEVTVYQEQDQFSISITLPEGAQVIDTTANDQFSMTELGFAAGGRPTVIITVAADELYVGQSLSDLTEDEKQLIISEITVEMAAPAVDLRTSPEGYEYIVANETTEGNDASDTVMLLNGYFIMVHVYYEDYAELTEVDAQIGPSIMETLQYLSDTAQTSQFSG